MIKKIKNKWKIEFKYGINNENKETKNIRKAIESKSKSNVSVSTSNFRENLLV